MKKHSLPAALILMVITMASCIRTPVDRVSWPEDLPPISHYEQVYAQDDANQAVQSREKYLEWVVRFYKGWKLYQDGWQATTRDVLYAMDEGARKARVERKLAELGMLISAEWAKNSEDRSIRSRELSIWGQALLKAMNQGAEEILIDQITRDVNALLSDNLNPADINLQRYGKPRAPAGQRL